MKNTKITQRDAAYLITPVTGKGISAKEGMERLKRIGVDIASSAVYQARALELIETGLVEKIDEGNVLRYRRVDWDPTSTKLMKKLEEILISVN